MAQERLQKIIARAGIASRRQSEALIREGLVTVNGKTVSLGDKADPANDAIKVKGKLLQLKDSLVYIAFHKPKGVITILTEDPERRPTLKSYLRAIKTRVFPVGRMDYNSEGLLLLTNDGDIAEKLQKSNDLPRIYHVKVKGHVERADLEKLEKGMRAPGRLIRPYAVKLAQKLKSKSLVEVVFVGQGSVDLKMYFEKKGFLVEKVARVGIGQISVGKIPPGTFVYLKKRQIEAALTHPELILKNYPNKEV